MESIFGRYYDSADDFAKLALPDPTAALAQGHVYSRGSPTAERWSRRFRARIAAGETLYLLGFQGFYHDAGIALVEASAAGGLRLLANLEEERYAAKKHFAGYPAHCVAELKRILADLGKGPADIFCTLYGWDVGLHERMAQKTFILNKKVTDNPWFLHLSYAVLPPEAMARSDKDQASKSGEYYLFAPLLSDTYRRLMAELGREAGDCPCIQMPHHENHAYYAFGVSPFYAERDRGTPVLVSCIDGSGDLGSGSLFVWEDGELKLVRRYPIADSLGIFYMLCASFLGGWSALSCEGRYMGAAAWGDYDRLTNPYYRAVRQYFYFGENGEVRANTAMTENGYALLQGFVGEFLKPEDLWNPDAVLKVEDIRHSPITRDRVDKAAAVQMVFEDALFHILGHLIRSTGSDRLVLCGGTALNCVANMRLLEHFGRDFYRRALGIDSELRIWAPPIPSDQGVVPGAAYQFAMRNGVRAQGRLPTPFLCGRPPRTEDIRAALAACELAHWEDAGSIADPERLGAIADFMAYLVARGAVVGIYQGAAETGPRALGHRSFLANPCDPDTLGILNSRVKLRERVRPLAPMVTREDAPRLFHLEDGASAADYDAYDYMVLNVRARAQACELIPAVVHRDGTSRIQIVRERNNPLIHRYLQALGRYTGVEVSVNTSLNVGSPIVQTPEQALEIFRRAQGVDCLVMIGEDGQALYVRARPGVQTFPSRFDELKADYAAGVPVPPPRRTPLPVDDAFAPVARPAARAFAGWPPAERAAETPDETPETLLTALKQGRIGKDEAKERLLALRAAPPARAGGGEREVLTALAQGRIGKDAAKARLIALRAAPAAGPAAAPAPRGTDIAIVGLSGRFPDAPDIATFWRHLRAGRSAIRIGPEGRGFEIADYYDPNPQTPGKTYSRHGAWLDGVDLFDPLFFGISPREAERMDPSERLFLQEAWRAIEDAGYAAASLRGARWGVFACAKGDYASYIQNHDPSWHAPTDSYAPGRLSYLLDLCGPCVSVDTACSSTLVAIAQACDALALGNADAAVAGGGGVYTTPNMLIYSSQAGLFSAAGRCAPFDAEADGTVLGEAVGAVVLKPLAAALRDGDCLYGVIKGWGVNHDGRTNGMTAPNPRAQARLLTEVYQRFGIDPADIGLVEAHGTGTRLGDPIELQALTEAFRRFTDARGRCALGSVKGNIGHAFFGAGIAGLAKVLMALRHREIPPSVHFRTPNPLLHLADSPFFVATEPRAWETVDGRARLAAVSSFGATGVNVHLVVAEPPETAAPARPDGPACVVLSARDGERLRELAERLHEFLAEPAAARTGLAAVAYTLQVGREAMDARLGLLASSLAEAREKLAAFLSGDERGVLLGQARPNRETLGIFQDDEDLREAVSRWLHKGKHETLLRLWCQGLAVDWPALYPAGTPPRVHLPTYPFARERCWIADRLVPGTPTRRACFLVKQWVTAPLPEPAPPLPGPVAVLGAAPIDTLARAVAARIPGARVVPSLDGAHWGAIVDLAGCTPATPTHDLSWLPPLQAAVERGRTAGLRLLAVSRGLERLPEDAALKLPGASLSGAYRAALYRMLAHEHPALVAGHLDLDPAMDETAAATAIAAELLAAGSGSAALRAGTRRAPRLVERAAGTAAGAASGAVPDLGLAPDLSLWITGGTRGLGLLCARRFAERHGVRRLLLAGRTGTLSDASRTVVSALEAQGVRVEVAALDLADPGAIRALRARTGPVGGLIHCAGLADDRDPAFVRKPLATFERIAGPKTRGLDALLAALEDEPLRFCVLFSSVAGAIPSLSVSQSDYALANAYMDFAAAALAPDLPFRLLSLQWPSWKETGMGEAASPAYRETGLLSHTDREGLDLLERAIAGAPGPVVMPAIVDGTRFSADRLLAPPAGPRPAASAPPAGASPGPAPDSAPDSARGSAPDSARGAAEWVARLFAAELAIDRERLDPRRPFADYGADSVLLTQIRARIERELGVRIDPSALLSAPSLAAFSEWLAAAHGRELAALAAPGAPAGDAPAHATDAPAGAPCAPPTNAPAPESPPRRRALCIRHVLDAPGTDQPRPIAPTPAAPATGAATARLAAAGTAVIGIACRFPDAPDLEAYWRLLCEGRSAIRAVRRPGWDDTYNAALLADLGRFDPDYFLIPRADAAVMDPQALLVLEEALAAFHHAGYTPAEVKGRPIGVYLGARSHHDPGEGLARARNPIVAAGQNYLAANLSQFFDLRGPSLVIDTACSSALVAMDLAIRALETGEIEAALVGGVNALADERALRVMRQRGLLARTPELHLFDRRAEGMALGEGVGMVLLKPRAAARAAGDRIHGVVLGLSINNDGRTAGPATPNFEAQQAVMAAALAKSGARPEAVGYLEANGSGSEVTDLLELKAIRAVYRPAGGPPLELGSMKPHIGHPLCAEGIAAFIKALLAVSRGHSTPFLSAREPMEHFDLAASPFRFARSAQPWDTPRLAAVNCFADGGSNAHVVLAAPDGAERQTGRTPLPPPTLRRIDVRPAGGAQAAPESFSKRLPLDGDHPVLKHHRAYGQSLLPGLAYVDLLYGALRERGYGPETLELRNLVLHHPLIVGPDFDVTLNLDFDAETWADGDGWRVRIRGREQPYAGGAPRDKRYAAAEIGRRSGPGLAGRIDLERVRRESVASRDMAELYAAARDRDLVHTGPMRVTGRVHDHGSGAVSEIAAEDIGAALFHPALLDGAAVAFAGLCERVGAERRLFLPLVVGSFRADAPVLGRCIARIPRASVSEKNELASFSLELFAADGRQVAELTGIQAKLVREATAIAPGLDPGLGSGRADRGPLPPAAHPAAPLAPAAAATAETYLGAILAERIGVAPEAIDPQAGYYEMGLDSAGLLELVQRLETRIGARLAPTLFFEYASVAELAAYLSAAYPDAWGTDAPAAPAAGEGPAQAGAQTSVQTSPGAPAPRRAGEEIGDIAVIGLAGRYPQSPNLRAFWANLLAGADCIEETPPERWDYATALGGVVSPSGKPMSRFGGFVAGHDRFDPRFFRISPREAEALDPQDRLFLETCWEAIEDAGYTPGDLAPPEGPEGLRSVGVFCGIMHKDYTLVGAEALSKDNPFPLTISCAPIPNRVSYVCNFHGPSMAVDTVCSSSLTTLHLAVQSIRNGECRVAIAGGVNLSLHPAKYLVYGVGELHSVDGRCRAFGTGGSGYVSAEGVGAAVLKPLAHAERDGDRIYAVVKGSAVNHVGKVSGITVPGPVAQGELIRSLHERTGIDPRTVGYVETHGTGTVLGDPIEIQGLTRAYRRFTDERGFCAIGSVKSNMGHGESAAGIMGFTKAVLQLHYRTLTPSLHAATLNPHIDFASSPFYVQRERADWVRPQGWPRRAAVSSFGATGSNAHLILEEYAPPAARPAASGPVLLPLSARDSRRLLDYAERLRDFLVRPAPLGDPQAAPDDLAFTFQVGREAMAERAAFVAADRSELVALLTAFLAGEGQASDRCLRGKAARTPSAGAAAEVQAAIAANDLARLARLWVAGAPVGWRTLHRARAPRRISAPTYPFARERYWVGGALGRMPAGRSAVAHGEVAEPPRVAPYRMQRAQARPGEDYAVRVTLTGEEFFLRDHVVAGERILPGVVTLDIALAAAQQAWPELIAQGRPRFRNLAWVQRVAVADAPVDLRVALVREGAATLRYTLTVECPDRAPEPQGSGLLERVPDAPTPPLDIAARLAATRERALEGHALYEDYYRPIGFDYGPSLRCVQRLHAGSGEVLVEIALPAAIAATEADFILHPSLIDGGLQGTAGIGFADTGGKVAARLPFGFDEIRVWAPLQARMWAWIRPSARPVSGSGKLERLDIDLTDPDGRLLVSLRGFASRAVPEPVAAEPAGACLYVPVWRERKAPAPRRVDAEIRGFVAGPLPVPPGAEPLGRDFAAAAAALLGHVRGILQTRPSQPLLLQVAVPADGPASVLAGLSGLLRTAQMENPRLLGQLIAVPADIALGRLTTLLAAETGAPERFVRHDATGQRQVRLFAPLPSASAPPAWREGGVYLISGGAGGLGRLLAEDAALRLTRGTLVLIGRRALDGERRTHIERLARPGFAVEYAVADATDRAALAALVADIRARHGALTGVVHSAGIVRDGLILRKTAADFAAVLAPKVAGAEALDFATRGEPLDFFVLFASGAGVTGNPGQADYAAANAYLDAFAARRAAQAAAGERTGRSLSIDWPLWRSGGMAMDAASERRMTEQTGMEALETAAGLAAFHRALAAPAHQVLVMAGEPEALGRFLAREGLAEGAVADAVAPLPGGRMPEGRPAIANGELQPVAVANGEVAQPLSRSASRDAVAAFLAERLAEVIQVPAAEIDPQATFDEHGLDSIMAIQVTNALERDLGALPKTLFFDYASLAELAGWFLAEHGARLAQLLGVPEREAPPAAEVASAASTASPAAAVAAFLAERLAEVIQVPAAEIDPQATFDEHGLDSIMAIQVTNALERDFGALPKTLFFDYASLAELAGWFLAEHGARLAQLLGVPDREAPPAAEVASAASTASPAAAVAAFLAARLAEVIQVPATEIDPEATFDEHGLDSIMAIQVTNALERDFGALPKTLFFDYASLAELAGWFLAEHGARLAQLLGVPEREAPPAAEPPPLLPLPPAEPDRRCELSHGQRAFCFLYDSAPDSAAYHVPFFVRLRSPLDPDLLARALVRLAARHPSLRTVFPFEHDGRVQLVRGTAAVPVTAEDVGGWDEASALARLAALYRTPFDFERGPLMRAHLLRRAADDTLLLLVSHHIVCDGWSLGVVVEELGALLEAECAGVAAKLPPLPADYTDFVARERALVAGPAGEAHWAYWRDRLGGALPVLTLPLRHPRPAVQTFNGATHRLDIDRALADALRAFARREGASFFVTLLAGFLILLKRLSGQEDIVVGAPFSGRTEARFNRVVGDLVNPVALRCDLGGEPTVRELLRRTRATVLAALAHQEYPFARLVERLNVPRDPARSAVFEVMFNFIQMPGGIGDLMVSDGAPRHTRWGGLDVETLSLNNQEGQLSLTFETLEASDAFYSVLKYNPDLFAAADIARMGERLVRVLRAMIDEPDSPLARLSLVSEAERSRMAAWNATAAGYPAAATIAGLFEEQAAARPDATALVCGDARTSYADLDARANRIANALIGAGLRPDERCALYLRPSADMLAAILGVLKAGATYVPMDPEYPRERIGYLLEDSAAAAVFAEGALAEDLRGLAGVPLVTPEDAARAGAEPPGVAGDPERIAYIIYTSGSTGRPKGCLVTHRNVVRLMKNDRHPFAFGPDDVWVLAHSYCFDFSVWEMYGALLYGGALVVPPRATVRDPGRFLELLRAHRISVLNQTPAAFYALIGEELAHAQGGLDAHLHTVIFGGDKLLPARLAPWAARYPLERIALVNMYGITETTVHVTYHRLAPADLTDATGGSPIGRPIPETTVHVLDAAGRPVPPGEIGEMVVGGSGVCAGYFNRPELTAERFVPNPFPEGGRLYRSGDLARREPDGSLRYFGRNDHQVKIRGHRIETKEIEHRLLALPGVGEAVVLARGEPSELVAFVVAGPAVEAGALKAQLAATLPEYMIPARFLSVAALPLTGNGKLDRAALLALAEARAAEPPAAAGAAPADALEETVAAVWRELLGLARPFGTGESFFDLGGDSLNAGQVVSRLRRELDVKLSMAEVFRHATVAELAALLRERMGLPQPPVAPVAAVAPEQAAAPAPQPETQPAPEPEPIPAAGAATDQGPIPPAGAADAYPLTHAQQRIWVLSRMEAADTAYNIPWPLLLEGPLDAPALGRALQALTDRHEALRTVFAVAHGAPVQRILPRIDLHLETLDLAAAADPQAAAREIATADFRRPFDLAVGPLVRARLLRLAEARHVLVLTLHHIVADGASLRVLFSELDALYAACAAGAPDPLPPPPVQYRDYAVWEQTRLAGPEAGAARAYWLERLGGERATARLPTDRPRPAVQTYRGEMAVCDLDPALAEGLSALARAHRATSFMVLLALTQVLLYKLSGEPDIVLGTPVAGRDRPDLEGAVGLFVNTLALRTRIDPDESVARLIDRVTAATGEDFAHQTYPFDRLIDELGVVRDLSRSPLFDTMLAYLDRRHLVPRLSGCRTSPFPASFGVAKLDLTFEFVHEGKGPLQAWIEYNTDLFEPATVARLWAGWVRLCTAAIADPERPVRALPFRSEADDAAARAAATGPRLAIDPGLTLVDLFERQAAATPEAVAILDAEGALGYDALERAANRLAHRLVCRANLGADDLVALVLERSRRIPIAILGVLKAGAAYVPIDPRLPAQRRRQILDDAGCRIAVTEAAHADDLRALGIEEIVEMDDECGHDGARGAPGPLTDLTRLGGDLRPLARPAPGDLAYAIYTSGSTGVPKGVTVEHRAVVNLVQALQARVYAAWPAPVEEAFSAHYAFDVAVAQLFCTLTRGDRLRIVPGEALADPRRLLDFLCTHPVDIVDLTPSQFAALLDAGLAEREGWSLRQITLGAETLPTELLRRFWAGGRHRAVRILNLYGPTEACVVTTLWEADPRRLPARGGAPIGTPLANTAAYVVNADRQPLPIGAEGEIAIGGAGLARGYLNRPDLTAQRFVAGPEGERIYLTGDRGRCLGDGTLEILGRLDDQVKLAGLRIELGEIEAALRACPGVVQAAARVLGEGAAAALVGYVAMPEPDFSHHRLKAHLAERLPGYMVPSRILRLDRLPTTSIGKVDRKALPLPAAGAADPSDRPATETQARVAEIVARVLGQERVGIGASFFDIGGASLSAVQVLLKVQEALGLDISLMTFFRAPTVAGLAAAIDAARTGAGEAAPLARLAGGEGPALFCLPPVFGYGSVYGALAEALAEALAGVAIYALDLPEGDDPAADCARSIRAAAPHGPIRLLGYSAGGNLAFEVAKALEAGGRAVGELYLLDAVRIAAAQPLDPPERDAQAAALFEQYAALMARDERLAALVRGEALRGRMIGRTRRFLDFLGARAQDGRIAADIRLLTSAAVASADWGVYGWDAATGGRLTVRTGSGAHEAMLFGEHARVNGAILADFLAGALRAERPAADTQ